MGRDTSARIFALITKLDPLICCLVETRADSLRLDRFSPKINKRCDLAAIEANGYSSGILVFWKKKTYWKGYSNGGVSICSSLNLSF